MQPGTMNRLRSGNAAPSDFQAILLAAQSPKQLEGIIRESQGHVETAQPGHFSTVTMVHHAVERLRDLRAAGVGNGQQSLVRVQPVREGQPGTKRARPVPVEPHTEYLKSGTFGGRGNFLPADAPVIFKRSMILPLLRDIPGSAPATLAKFKVEEVKLVAREPGARRAIPVLRVQCLCTKAGPTAKPTLTFTAKGLHGLRPGCSCITMPGGPDECFTAPVDTVPAALPAQFTVRGYLDGAIAQRVADFLNGLATQSRSAVVWEEYHVQNDQPYLYCVTCLEDAATAPAQQPQQPEQAIQPLFATGTEWFGNPPQQGPVSAFRTGAAQSMGAAAGQGFGGGDDSGNGGSGGRGPGTRPTQLHGDFSSLAVGIGFLPAYQVLTGSQSSLEVGGAARFHGDVSTMGELQAGNAAFSGQLSARSISATTATVKGNLSAGTFEASEAKVSGTLSYSSLHELSDMRFKQNIELLQTNALELVMQLEMYTYSLRSDATGEQHTGFLAQQLRKVIPSAVVERNGRLHVKPTSLTAFLTKAVQELRIETRRQWAVVFAAIHNLESRINVTATPNSQGYAAIADSSMGTDQMVDDGEEEVADAMMMLGGDDAAEHDAAGAPSGSSQGSAGIRLASSCPLASLSVPAAIQYLKTALCEDNPGIDKMYAKLLAALDREEVYEAMQQALKSTSKTASGEKLRTAGGEFLKLCKAHVATKKVGAAALDDTPRDLGGTAPRQLRQYQQRAIARLAAGENILLVLPTGGGKTEVALQHTLAVLRADPAAKTVFLVPNIALAYQQAGYFQRQQSFHATEGYGRLRVACYHSDYQLAPRDWQAALGSHDVIVATGQTLLNALAGGKDRLAAVRFLVFDEVHHAKLEHPYSVILREHYSRLPENARSSVQILGMTATPGGHVSEGMTEAIWNSLAKRINGSYEVADVTHPEVPRARELAPIIVQPLQEDLKFSLYTCAAIMETLDELWCSISGYCPPPPSIRGELSKGSFSPAVQAWINGILVPKHPTAERVVLYVPVGLSEDWACCLRLMAACNIALLVREEAGHRAGIDYVGRAFMHITECSSMAKNSELKDTRWVAWRGLVGRLHEACGQPLEEICIEEATLLACFPKFCALRRILKERCEEQSEFHGMVFVRTRLGLYLVEKALKAEASLSSISFSQLIGKGAGGGAAAVGTARGMSGKEQARVLEVFRKPGGRKVLVATAAGLEGLDIPDCNFCVRYNASQTAIERVQSRGRTRKAAAEFIEIFEDGSQDAYFQRKVFLEEQNMAHVAKRFSSMQLK